MEIRVAGVADVRRVEGIVRAAYEPWVTVVGMRPIPMEADYARLVGDGLVWVAGEPVDGLIVLVPEAEALLVENVAVEPGAQGKGVGRALLAFAEEEARRLGKAQVRLYTNRLMASNIALYERVGYVRTRQETIDGRQVVHLEKWLGQV
ncbi:GNAT family N-acetyltransferase [Actinocorallia lasiicapitis]